MAFSDVAGRFCAGHAQGCILPLVPIKDAVTILEADLINLTDAAGAILADSDVGAGPIHAHGVAVNGGTGGTGLNVEHVSYVCDVVVNWPSAHGGTVGGQLWASGTPGGYTQTRPAATNAREHIGRVLSATSAHIVVNPTGAGEVVA